MTKKKIVVKGISKPTKKKKKVVVKAKSKTKTAGKSAKQDAQPLTAFDKMVLIEYLKSLNQTKAYIDARKKHGLKRVKNATARSQASALFSKPAAEAELEILRQRLVDRTEIDLNRLIEGYGQTAFSNPADMIIALQKNTDLHNLKDLEDKLHGFDVTIEAGEDNKPLIKLSHKQTAVNQARNSLTRIFGGFKDNLNLTGQVSVVGQILEELDGDTSSFEPGE